VLHGNERKVSKVTQNLHIFTGKSNRATHIFYWKINHATLENLPHADTGARRCARHENVAPPSETFKRTASPKQWS